MQLDELYRTVTKLRKPVSTIVISIDHSFFLLLFFLKEGESFSYASFGLSSESYKV
jgi:hypothetical protein